MLSQGKYFFIFLFLISLSFLFGACQVKQFNEEEPYAVLVNKYRSYHEAKQVSERLTNRGLKNYIIKQHYASEGIWYNIFLGKKKILEHMMEDKMVFEDDFGLQNLSIINYNKIRTELLAISDTLPISAKNVLKHSEVKKPFSEIIEMLPYSKNYHISNLKIVAISDSVNVFKLSQIKKLVFDLPRGMRLQDVMKNATAIAEATYSDEILGKEMLFHIITLKKNNLIKGDSLTKRFSEYILRKDYKFEEANPVEIPTKAQLKGFQVSLTPNENRLVHYFLLSDIESRFLIFLQSPQNKETQMLSFCSNFGKGIISSDQFFNSFYRHPVNAFPNDELIGFQLFKNEVIKSKNIRKETGHYQSRHLFYNYKKGSWEFAATYIAEAENKKIVLSAYSKKRLLVDSLQLLGKPVYVSTARRKSLQNGRTIKMIDELLFDFGNGIGIISNKKSGRSSPLELLEKAKKFQLNSNKFINDEEDYFDDF